MTRTFSQRPFRLRAHLERLYDSLRLLEIDCGLTIDEMQQVTLQTLHHNLSTEADDIDWQIMHDVSRGPLPLYRTAFSEPIGPTVSINCWPLITHMGGFARHYDSGIELMIPAQQTFPAHLLDLKAKTRSRVHYRLAELQAGRSGDCWPVLVDPDGFLAEGPGWNIFLVKNGVLLTPEARNILRGVSRETTIELARQLGIEVRETNLGRYEALLADEIFCTATSCSLVHASSFEGQLIGDGTPGPLYLALQNAWKERVGIDFVAQAHSYASRLQVWLEQDAKFNELNGQGAGPNDAKQA
ncbi:MAG: aminotransferase class IV [Planctomycetaceae bacterium]